MKNVGDQHAQGAQYWLSRKTLIFITQKYFADSHAHEMRTKNFGHHRVRNIGCVVNLLNQNCSEYCQNVKINMFIPLDRYSLKKCMDST